MEKLVLFDFDGVIVNTFEMVYSLHDQLDIEMTKAEYRDMFMGNIQESVNKMFPKKNDRKNHHDKLFELYSSKLLKEPIIKGIAEVIKTLGKKYKLAIISSAINSPIHAYLRFHDIHNFFDTVYGLDVHASKVKKIEMIFDKYNTTPKNCIFITDTVGDVIEASHKKIKSIAVTWGFHEKERFKNNPPLAFVDTAKELEKEINKYFLNLK